MKLISVLFLLQLASSDCYSICFQESFVPVSDQDSTKSSKTEKRASGTLKFDPLQIILSCEIPLSIEVYFSQTTSLQVQAGYVFPAAKESLRRKLYESSGENGNAMTSGMFYYRDCPYNNDGSIDIRTEIRQYFKPIGNSRNGKYKSTYYAFQGMYRYYYYDKLSVYLGSPYSYGQTESKKANIFGLAIIFGKQKCLPYLITDMYGGIGFKVSNINYTILGVSRPLPPSYPRQTGRTGSENQLTLYLNFGFRIGFEI